MLMLTNQTPSDQQHNPTNEAMLLSGQNYYLFYIYCIYHLDNEEFSLRKEITERNFQTEVKEIIIFLNAMTLLLLILCHMLTKDQ